MSTERRALSGASETGRVDALTLARRQIWGAADQALFSATSFACAVAVGRTGRPQEFGAFAAAYLLYLLSLGAVEAFTAEVVVVRAASRAVEECKRFIAEAAGCALIAGAPVMMLGAAALVALDGGIARMAPPILLLAPLLFLQDLWRYGLFALHRPRAAFANDLVWASLQGVLFVTLAAAGAGAEAYVWAWSSAGAVAGLLGAIQIRIVPAPRRARVWARAHGRLGMRFAAEYLTLFGAAQSVLAIVGVSSGLVAAAGYRAGQLVYGPLQVLLNATRLSVTPLIARAKETGWEDVGRGTMVLGFGLSAVAAAWCLAVLHLPTSAGEAILGDSWREARGVVAPMGATSLALAASLAAVVVLRVAEAVARTLPIRLAVAGSTLVLGAIGALVNGARGAAIGVAAAQSAGAVALCVQARRELQMIRGEESAEVDLHDGQV